MGAKVKAWEEAGRARMRSPGRPPVGRVDHRRWFWQAIARGDSSLEAAAFAGVSGLVGVRWFREGVAGCGGHPSRAVGAVTVVCPARGDRAAARRGQGRACDRQEHDRSASTISRELRRNAATRGGRLDYRASVAQWHAEQRGKRPKVAKLAVNRELREYVQARLAGQVRR